VESSFLAIPQGFVAYTLPTSEQQGVAGAIQPGDYIGIIAIVDKAGQTASKTILTDVHVIRVGTASDAQSHAASGSSAGKTATATGSSLTVVMNECDAEYLNWFLAKATLRYTLENYQDYNKGTANNPQQAAACPIDKAAGVSSADVAKRYGAELVP
jgi:Flp pilus assembly protein CpaB